jgi:hypothetical protein
MRSPILILILALLVAIALYGAVNGGHTGFTIVILALVAVFVVATGSVPRRSLFILCAGIPLTLTTGSDPLGILLVSFLLLGLYLERSGDLSTTPDRIYYLGGTLLFLPLGFFLYQLQGTILKVLFLLILTGIFCLIFMISRLRFQARYRGEGV